MLKLNSNPTSEAVNEAAEKEIHTKATFMNLSYEEKDSSVGNFWQQFLDESHKHNVSPSAFAAYLGSRSSYMHNRNKAEAFKRLLNGVDLDAQLDCKTASVESVECVACGRLVKCDPKHPGQLQSHMKRLHPNYNNNCLSCGVYVNSWKEHVEHAAQVHEGIVKIQCNGCEGVFNSKEELSSHKSKEHWGKSGLKVCIECGKQLRPISMTIHMRTEHGSELIQCPKCPKQFKHPKALEAHNKRSHEDHMCHTCGKVCNSKKALKFHTLTNHTPDALKPW